MRDRVYLKIGILVFLIVVISGGIVIWKYFKSPKNETEVFKEEKWEIYSNKDLKFEIQYPREWKFFENNEKDLFTIGFMDPLEESLIMLAVLPKDNMTDEFGDFSTLDEAYTNLQIRLKEDPESEIVGPKIELKEINNQKVLRLIYPPDPVDQSIDIEAFILRGEKLYWLKQTFAKSSTVFDRMLSTFRFVE